MVGHLGLLRPPRKTAIRTARISRRAQAHDMRGKDQGRNTMQAQRPLQQRTVPTSRWIVNRPKDKAGEASSPIQREKENRAHDDRVKTNILTYRALHQKCCGVFLRQSP